MLALLLALASPELDVRGISVSYGNTVVENAFRNAVAILRRAGKRTTLAVGARRPLKRPLAVARDTHGESGLGYAELPPAGVILDFVKSLDRLLAEQSDPVTLVTLGPVTSLALALRGNPQVVRAKVARHIAMIGNVGARGNTTRYAEFNAWCDPEALDVVLRAELPTEMVGLDVTREMVLAQHETTRLQHAGAPQARWINDALRFYIEFHKQQEGLAGDRVRRQRPGAGARCRRGAAPYPCPGGAGARHAGHRGARLARVHAGAEPAPGRPGRRLGDRGDSRGRDREAEAVRLDRAGDRSRHAAHQLLERPPPR